MRDFLGRPPGAEEHQQTQQATAMHTTTNREARIHDVLFNIGYFSDEAKARNEPLSLTVERDTVPAASGELPILPACLHKLGIHPQNGFGKQASLIKVIKENKTAQKLSDAYHTEKMYYTIFGGIEQRKLEAAASTRDSVPDDTAANPSLQTPLKDRKIPSPFSFDIEDVYADVIMTDLRNIDELIFENEDTGLVNMFLRKELADIKTSELKISEAENRMTQIAIATRWSEEFGDNTVRMDAVTRWRNQVAIAARNALRNMGLYKIANDGSPTTKTLTGGKTRGNLMRMGFELGEAYPTNLLVMDVTTMAAWMVPGSSDNIAQTLVPQMLPLNLLYQPAPNTDLGVTKDDVWLTDTTDKILNYVRDLTLNLYVKDDTFMMRVFFDSNNLSYRGIITFDYCPVFIDRNGRIIWTIS